MGPGIGAASVHVGCGCVAVRVRQEETTGRCNFRHVIHSPLPRSRESSPAAAVQLVRRIIDPLMMSQSVVGECRDQICSVPVDSSRSPRRFNNLLIMSALIAGAVSTDCACRSC